jgi:hypothetical protein
VSPKYFDLGGVTRAVALCRGHVISRALLNDGSVDEIDGVISDVSAQRVEVVAL